MKLKFNGILVLLVVLMAQLTLRKRVVTGVVSDNAGMPIPGVSVLVKGTKFGTNTDFDGKYAIKATPSQILTFSYIGMKTQSMAASSSSVNITMIADAFELEGVVVTALGIKREKKRLDMPLNKLVVKKYLTLNFVNSLSGKVAGLDIKSSGISVGLLK
jgi:hypothetical protein